MQIAYSTEHATARQRQRGIPAPLLGLLMRYGKQWHDGHGATIVGFDKRSRRRMSEELGKKEFARWESRLGIYAVVGEDGALVTVGHRRHRIRSAY